MVENSRKIMWIPVKLLKFIWKWRNSHKSKEVPNIVFRYISNFSSTIVQLPWLFSEFSDLTQTSYYLINECKSSQQYIESWIRNKASEKSAICYLLT